MSANPEILSILQKAYQVETDGYTFYSMIAERTDKDAVRDLFGKLARDEVLHKAYLKEISGQYEERGVAAFVVPARPDPSLRVFADRVLTDRFKEQARGATFEVSAVSIGMTLETNAMALFGAQADTATDPEVREFYRFLCEWERQHYEALQDLFQEVRQDLFTGGGFNPF
jgi:rubrerythrin